MSGLLFNDRYRQMPWDEVDAVVFDIGNVLMRFDPGYVLTSLFPQAERREKLLRAVFQSPYWIELDRGTLTYADAPRAMAQGDAALEADIAFLLARWCDFKPPIEQGFAAARACRAQGKKTCLLSNYHREAFEYIDRTYAFFSEFDVRMISCYVHQLKPDAQIYQTLIRVAGLNPARSLFLDDTLLNVQAAMAQQMGGYWVRDWEEMASFFGVKA
jgi:FMN phosphatase YigB (HAD superfamily)